MLYTTDPVRNRGWWLRTAIYWLVLLVQDAGSPGDAAEFIGWVFSVLSTAVLVYFRDRYPLALAIWTLLATWTFAETPIALGMVAVASRARSWPWVLGYAVAGAGGLVVPWPKLVNSGLTATGPDPFGFWLIALHVLLFVVVPALVGMMRRANRQANQQRLGFEAEQRKLAAQQAVFEERNRIAQEMHDVLGHKLSLITVQAGALEVSADPDSPAAEQAELIRGTARQALDELREILGVLGSPQGDQLHPQPDLATALELVEHNRASGMRIEVDNELPADLQLPGPTGAAVHRIVQEGLTNALRHAPGAAAQLVLRRPTPAVLQIELVNRPSAQRGAGPGSGRGLPGLQERVRSLGGRLDAGPTPEGGYRLSAELPLPSSEKEQADE